MMRRRVLHDPARRAAAIALWLGALSALVAPAGAAERPLVDFATEVAAPALTLVLAPGDPDLAAAARASGGALAIPAETGGDPRAESWPAADLVLLASPHGGGFGRAPRGGAGEASLYTREAFAKAWAAVAADGWLAWLAADELVFVRGINALWEELRRTQPDRAAMAQESWGFRLISESAGDSPYRYVLLLPKRAPAEVGGRLLSRVDAYPFRDLFGPNRGMRSRYVPLTDVEGLDAAHDVLQQQFSARIEELAIIRPATDDGRPIWEYRYHRPWSQRGLLVGVVGALLGILLFALPARRRVDRADPDRWPVPVQLGEPAVAVVGSVGALWLLLEAAQFRGGAELTRFVVPVLWLGAAARAMLRPWPLRVTLLGWLVVLPVVLGVAEQASPVRVAVAVVAALVSGTAIGTRLGHLVRGADASVARWSLAVIAIATIGVPAFLVELGHDRGAREAAVTWLIAGVLYAGLREWIAKRDA